MSGVRGLMRTRCPRRGFRELLVYVLSGCDFLPAIYNMPFKRMLAFTMDGVVCQVGLFTSPVLALDSRGRWIGSVEGGVKLLAAYYFQLHRNVFQTAMSSAVDMFAQSSHDVKSFVANVRETIWRVHHRKARITSLHRIAHQEGSFC